LSACLLSVGRRLVGSPGVIRVWLSPAGDADVRIAMGPTSEPPRGALGALNELESGLGLSLPIARRVIEAAGGRVEASDGAPPFIAVTLPRLAAAATSPMNENTGT
jgi:hypothetical protein